jgi:hypothetical protein
LPDQNYIGLIPGIPPQPLDNYARNRGGGWEHLVPPFNQNVAVGLQIAADPIEKVAS